MTHAKKRKLTWWTAAVAAAVLALAGLYLLGDAVAERGRVEREKAVIAQMQEQVLVDAESAPLLDTERESQTNRSLARDERNYVLAWIVLVSAVLFLAAAKVYQDLGEPVLPTREELIQIRLSPGSSFGFTASPSQVSGNGSGEIDLAFVDAVVERVGKSREAAIPILQAIQTHYRYLPEEALRRVCEITEITPAQIAGSATFYAQFRRKPVGEHVVRVCHGTACHVAGVEQVTEELRRQLKIEEGQDTDPEKRFTLDPVACLGCCSLAPVMMVGEETAGRLTPTSAWEALRSLGGLP